MSRADVQAMVPDLQHPDPYNHCSCALTSWEAVSPCFAPWFLLTTLPGFLGSATSLTRMV